MVTHWYIYLKRKTGYFTDCFQDIASVHPFHLAAIGYYICSQDVTLFFNKLADIFVKNRYPFIYCLVK